ncbi:hypothetical protein Y032_0205g1925 [Ancylostoma ceylanicum]|uniref:B-block binding subunit of TFIIIC domain-containing protein n=1 Tax=Ancylostoma ceylanicum TaxID=53326 RepID=A0A016SMD7_9BILA|nr:hypothetical protein Y032_0205g1925 [Ancylostoma ceylanicum]
MLATASSVKTEVGAVSNDAVEDQIYSIVQSSEDGLDTDTISALTAAIPVLDRQNAINNLLVTKRLVISKTSGGTLRLKVNTNTQLSGATDEEQAIYSLIEDSKRKGIWIRELRDGSGLSQIQLRKVLKSLEQKKLIKNVKWVKWVAPTSCYRMLLCRCPSFRNGRRRACGIVWSSVESILHATKACSRLQVWQNVFSDHDTSPP